MTRINPRPRRQPEKAEQAAIVKLLRGIGCAVYVLGTRRPAGDYQGTCMTAGIGDVYAFLPRHTGTLWVEVKAAGGRPSPAQVAFQEACQACGQAHVLGGQNEVIAWLLEHGYIHEGQVPHYRLPEAQ
jgi:hypothetical protein